MNRKQYYSVIKKELADSGNLQELLSSGDRGTGTCITVINNLVWGCMQERNRNATHSIRHGNSLLSTPLRNRSDDNQEMEIWCPVHF